MPQPDERESSKFLGQTRDFQEQNRYRCLKGTISPNRRCYSDAAVEGEANGSDHQHHLRDRAVQLPEINGKCNREKKEGKLQHDRQRLHDQVQSPFLES